MPGFRRKYTVSPKPADEGGFNLSRWAIRHDSFTRFIVVLLMLAGAIATTMVWSVLAVYNAMRVARRGGVRHLSDIQTPSKDLEAMQAHMVNQFAKFVSMIPYLPDELQVG